MKIDIIEKPTRTYIRETIEVEVGIIEEDAKKVALASVKVQKWLAGKEPKKIIFIKGKLVSIVV